MPRISPAVFCEVPEPRPAAGLLRGLSRVPFQPCVRQLNLRAGVLTAFALAASGGACGSFLHVVRLASGPSNRSACPPALLCAAHPCCSRCCRHADPDRSRPRFMRSLRPLIGRGCLSPKWLYGRSLPRSPYSSSSRSLYSCRLVSELARETRRSLTTRCQKEGPSERWSAQGLV